MTEDTEQLKDGFRDPRRELQRSTSKKKVADLDQLLSNSEIKSHPEAGSDIGKDTFLSSSEVATRLFAKAPPEFLERKSLDQLAAITEDCVKALQTITPSGEVSNVTFRCDEKRSALVVAQNDRPFIINSISECIRDLGITTHVFLHPILLVDRYRVSLSYIEMEPLSNETLGVLSRRVKSALNDLRLITDDYTSVLVRSETLARILGNPKYASIFPRSEQNEVADFLKWLANGGYVFLGHAEWRTNGEEEFPLLPSATLGIFRSENSFVSEMIREAREDSSRLVEGTQPILVTRLRTLSPVHRRSRIINITLSERSSDGKAIAIHSFLGLFTSQALSQESSSIPLIRRKLGQVTELEEVFENSFDHKSIVNIIDSMPKDEALSMDTDALREVIHTIMSIQDKNDTRVSVRFDPVHRGVSILIVLPRDRFNTNVRDRLQTHVESVFRAAPGSSEYHLDLSNRPHARLYFYIPTAQGDVPPIDLVRLEADIADLSRTWIHGLEEQILDSEHFSDPEDIWFVYGKAFPQDYQATQRVDSALADIEAIHTLSTNSPLGVGMAIPPHAQPQQFSVIVYNQGAEITLSHALPILEKAGFNVIHEKSYCISPKNRTAVYVHRFLVEPKSGVYLKTDTFDRFLAPGLTEIFLGEVENDMLNSLMLNAELDLRAISLLRTYCNLLWQVSGFATRGALLEALASEPTLASQLWHLFDIRFNPAIKSEIQARTQRFQTALTAFNDALREVTDITKDRILRSCANLLEHTVRTNFYTGSPSIVLKLHSREIDVMPHPRPLYEIFISSPRIQGTHLRCGKVARGGIRWSDRNQDFRSEVLGLMKTQKIKNALIVPDGAKGGFVINSLPKDPEELRSAVREGYKEFIRSLLSVTDNRVEDAVVHPDDLILYDEPDPYLVVAADKGTAAFSDIANEIATKEFTFWLGDAFASGGSEGYDHKLYGITARGAWESVKRHFTELRINYLEEAFTVVGIGDLSGDVFGNGMLLSDNIKLIAAFNHKHIFIDPDPDPKSSFKERTRLFELSRSGWDDYNASTLSQGGAIFGRFDKEIKLSEEARSALEISSEVGEVLNGEEVIAHILRAQCDLLWNGGIGTYVKSQAETHAEVNDGTNDRVRVDANELRTRVVGEGGNLGFTQRARIEFAARGGRIHTDAIDNSAGVDLSDHEVNLKILFAELVKTDQLSIDTRNTLLKEIASDVVESVLAHNRNHSLVLTVGSARSKRNTEYFTSLIRELTQTGIISRTLEQLPDDDEITERSSKEIGLYRPELAVCIGGVKLAVKDKLLASSLPEDPLLAHFLVNYFPVKIQERYPDAITNHPLARHIITTQVTNTVIDAMGVTFVHRMCLTHSTSPVEVIKCALAARIVTGTGVLRAAIGRFHTFHDNSTFIKLRKQINRAEREATAWLLSYHGESLTLAEIVERYKEPFGTLIDHAEEVFHAEEHATFKERLETFETMNFTVDTARRLAALPYMVPIAEILWTARESDCKVELVAQTFYHVVQNLGISNVLRLDRHVKPDSKWENELLIGAFDDIRRSTSRITEVLLKRKLTSPEQIKKAVTTALQFEQLMALLDEVGERNATAAAISVLAKHIKAFQI